MALNFPSSPALNEEYPVVDPKWKWNGYAWDLIGSVGGGGGASEFYYQSTTPTATNIGARWIHSDTGAEYIWVDDGTSTQWMQATYPSDLNYTRHKEVVLSDKPYRYYRLNDLTGSVMLDSSANAISGTYFNTPTLGRPSLLFSGEGNSALFDNVSEYASFPTSTWSAGASSVVIAEAIVNVNSTSVRGAIFSVPMAGFALNLSIATAPNLAVAGNDLVLYNVTSNSWGASTGIGTGTKHVALAFDKGTAIVYVFLDGVCVLAQSVLVGSAVDGAGSIGCYYLASGGGYNLGLEVQEFALMWYPSVASTMRLPLIQDVVSRHYRSFKRGV